jgi:hypothetical protein
MGDVDISMQQLEEGEEKEETAAALKERHKILSQMERNPQVSLLKALNIPLEVLLRVHNHREAELMREIASSAGIFDLLLNNYETLAYKSQVSVRSTCCGHCLILYHFTVKQTLLVTHNENLKLVQD